MKKGFDSKRYLEAQTKKINSRVKKFNKLYLEFGGKLLYDGHASRVLPGYDPRVKIKLLKKLKEKEIIYCVGAKNIQSGQIIGDSGLTQDKQVLKDIEELDKLGLKVSYLIITRYDNQPKVNEFIKKLKINYYLHKEIPGYSKNALKGYEKLPYVETKENLVIVTGVGGGSGKMAFCLSQIYHENKKGTKSGFAKFETFPIWNLKMNHPVNIAYEAATADLGDYNMVDKSHKGYAVNYNRDVDNFKILKRVMKKFDRELEYDSPTDMGVNMAKEGIIDDKVCREAAKKEIIRRYKVYSDEFKKGRETRKTLVRMREIIQKI